MTAKRDLKRRVRARQAQTGERYTTALQHVLASRSAGGFPVVELVDLSAEARRLGLRCDAAMAPELVERVDPVAALERLRDALLATADDPALGLFRAVLLRGERPVVSMPALATFHEAQRFLARTRAGMAGTSEDGRLLALQVPGKDGGEMMVCLLWLALGIVQPPREPRLILSGLDGLFSGPEFADARLPRTGSR